LQESGRQPGYWSAPEFGSRHQELSEQAGELKAVKKISLADCFAAALAKREKAEIYTGNPEFETVEREIKVFGYSASCSSKKRRNTQSLPFRFRSGAERKNVSPMPGSWLKKINLDEIARRY
jgi:hypothetical protein